MWLTSHILAMSLTAYMSFYQLQMQLNQRERELELQRDIPPGSSGEAQVLRKRLGLAEAAIRAGREKEHRMEDVSKGVRCVHGCVALCVVCGPLNCGNQHHMWNNISYTDNALYRG